jgi:DNA-binding NtrC family response regulator
MGYEQLLEGTDTEREPASTLLTRLFPEHLPTLKEAEHYLIEEALRHADGNQGIASNLLGITRQALNKRLIRRRR